MTRRRFDQKIVTPLDIALLRVLASEGNVVRACRALGITRDRGVYRLARLARLTGRSVVVGRRGGRTPGGTRLSPTGQGLLRRGAGSLTSHGAHRPLLTDTIFAGVWHARPEPHVAIGPSLRLVVTFRANEGSPVRVAVDPSAILLSRTPVSTSARNVLRGKVRGIERSRGGQRTVDVRVGTAEIPVAVTPTSVRTLRLRKGSSVCLYLKATSIRRA